MHLKYLICENCRQVVARFSPAHIHYPVRGEDFQSHLADRGVRAPWSPGVEPAYMKCPVCPKRVFHSVDPEELTISDNIEGVVPYRWKLPIGAQPPEPDDEESCPTCGKVKSEFKTAAGFTNHIRYCMAKHGGVTYG
jgi:rubrerythrin